MENHKQNRTLSPQTHDILSSYKEIITNLDRNVEGYTKKLELLQKGWLQGGLLVEKCSKDASENILSKLLKHSWSIVLVGEWNNVPSKDRSNLRLLVEKMIENCLDETPMVLKCKYLLKIYNNPWADPCLAKILTANADLRPEEEQEFHNNELGPIMTIRLQKLCDTDCEELALNYSESCLRCIPANNVTYKETRQLISDINLGLLVSLGKKTEYNKKVEKMDVPTGLAFIRRYNSKLPFNASPETGKLLIDAATVVASEFLVKSVVQPVQNKESTYHYLIILKEWLSLHKNKENFSELVHHILGIAISSLHLYYCAKIIEKGIGDQARYLAIEVHIRGITQDLNEIEMNKYDGEVTAESILKLESALATPYVRLAEMFYDNEHVKRECYLTAFSLRPVQEIFDHVRNNRIIRENESEVNVDIKSLECTHEVVSATSNVPHVYCKYCGKYRNANDEELTKFCEIFLNAETLANVPANFHSDLIILVQSPRIKQLSWSMPWYELEMNCQKLMDEERKLELTNSQLVNANDQLQYLDLDYSMFRHLPEAEVPGIEKGYEQYLISSDEGEESQDEDYESKVEVKKESQSAEKKNYAQYFESSDDSDKEYPLFGQRRKRDKRRKAKINDENYQPVRRTVRPPPRIFIDKSKTNVPPKKRLHRSLKKKVEFDYNNPHARFYIVCRKAQLDIKKQRTRLLHKRDNKYFYNFLEEAKIKKPVNETLAEKNIKRLASLNRNLKTMKEREQNPKLGRNTAQKLVFSNGVVAKLSQNGSISDLIPVKRKRPPKMSEKADAGSNQEIKKEPVLGPDGEPLPVEKKKRPPRPKPAPILGPDGEPLPTERKKRPSRPKPPPKEPTLGPDGLPVPLEKKKRPPRLKPPPLIGPDGQPLPTEKKKRIPKPLPPLFGPDGQLITPEEKPKPIRRPKPKTPSNTDPTIDASKYEAAEVLAQLGSATFDPAALVNYQEMDVNSQVNSILKSMLDKPPVVCKKVLTEQNGVSDNDESGASDTKKTRGRPKGVKNKIKLDADGNPLPKPPRKSKSRKSSDASTLTNSTSDASIRSSITSVVSFMSDIKPEIREEFLTPSRDSVIVSNVSPNNDLEDNPLKLYEEPVNVTVEKEIPVLPPIDLTETDDDALYPVKQERECAPLVTQFIGDDGIPVGIIAKTPKRKSEEMLMGSNGETMKVKKEVAAKKLVVVGVNGTPDAIKVTKSKKVAPLQQLTPEERREIELAKKREYNAKRRARLRAEQAQDGVPKPQKRPSNAKPRAKKVTKPISLPPALINAGRLEVNVPSLPIDSHGKIIPTPPISAENSIDFETLIKCDVPIMRPIVNVPVTRPISNSPISNGSVTNGLSKRITRSKSRSSSPLIVQNPENSPKRSKSNLPSHLIQTVNYSFISHRYNDSGGLKRRFANFVNYTAGCLPSKTNKLSFNELRSVKDALNETWTKEERVELEQMMSRYFYDIHPVWKIKKESQIIERRNYLPGVNDNTSDSHKPKNFSKILIRKDYLPNNVTTVVKEETDKFFRNQRLLNSAQSGDIELFLNDVKDSMNSGMKNDNKNDKKNYKNRFCKLIKVNVESTPESSASDKCDKSFKQEGVKSQEDVKNYLLATVPGMTDFEFFEMPETERSSVVEIVHVKEAGHDTKNSSDDSNPSSSNTSTSSGSVTTVVAGQSSVVDKKNEGKKTPTQVTAHIQRIAHPIQISSGSVIKASTSTELNNRPKYLLQRTVTNPTPTSTSAQLKNPTLINVLSHQVLVPGTKTPANANKITVTNGSGVTIAGSQPTNVILNNFKPGQTPTKIVKSFPQNWTISPSITTNAGSCPVTVSTSASQANSQHLLQILNSPPNIRKNLTIKEEKPGNNGVVQFICKTDGKMIHLTPINNATTVLQEPHQGQNIILNSLLSKKPKEEEPDDDTTAPRSVYEENYANFIRTGPKNQATLGQKQIQVVVSGAGGTQFQLVSSGAAPGNLILQNNKLVAASSLPKFNQVFGKTVTMYQPGTSDVQEIKSPDGKKPEEKKHIIVQTSSATGATQNILIHNKTGRAQILKNEGLKLITSSSQATSSNEVTPLRISVPLIPRSQPSMIGQTRIVRPIIQLTPNIIKNEVSGGQNVIVTTAPRGQRGQNIRLENLLLAAQQSQTPSTSSSGSKNVDTSTLEQLREFDMVLEQVKERSTSVPSSPQSCPGQSPVRPNQVTVINHVKSSVASSSLGHQQQQRVQEIIYTTAQGASVLQKVNFTFLQQSSGQTKPQNASLGTPLVVVTNYSQNPSISPALSVTSQLSSPTRSLSSVKSLSNTKVTAAIAVKPKTMHSPGSASSSSKTLTPKSSPLPKPIQKPQEDEQTVQRIYDILAEYAEQLRNSPDLNNKPAPRRRSNPPTNPATPSTKKKKSGKKYQGGSDVNSDYEGNFESEDSSLGPGSVSGIPSTPSMNNFSPSEPDLTLMDDQSDTSMDHHRITPKQTETKPDKSSVAKQLIFSEGSSDQISNNSGNKGVVIKETALNEVIAQAGKLGNNAAVLMPGNYLLPVNLLKSGRQIAILTSANGSKILAALPGTSNASNKPQLASPIKEQVSLQEFKRLGNDQDGKIVNKNEPQQVLCLRTVSNNAPGLIMSPNSDGKVPDRTETPATGTAIIISSPKGKRRYLINDPELLSKLTKGGELSSADVKKLIELQETPASVITTTTSTSVSQIQSQIQTKVLQMHKHINSNGEVELDGDRNDTGHQLSTQYQGKIIRSDRKIVEVMNQRNSHNQQAALERELRLQKSLSEECEDLGVDEPEDLFPEAGLLFDSLDPSSQEHGMGIDTPKVDKLTPIFFAEERKMKISPQTVTQKHEEVKSMETQKKDTDDTKPEDPKSKEDMYEFNADEKSSDDNTDTEYNRFLHKKLGRLNNQPPMFSYKRKRSINTSSVPSVSPLKKKVKAETTEDDDNDDMITIIDHHSTDADAGSTTGEDIEDVINTNVVQSVGATLVVSTEKPTSPHTRRASTRGHVKKNCPCCKPKKNSTHITHTHDQPPVIVTPSPVMTRKLRASIGSPSGSSTHSSSSPSTSSSLGGGQSSDVNLTATTTSTQERTRGRNRNATVNNKQPTSKLSKRR